MTVIEKEINELDQDFPASDIEGLKETDDKEYAELADLYNGIPEVPADWDEPDRPAQCEELDIKEAVKNLEEHEDTVECKCCFELFPKAECVKTDDGYLCVKCDQERHSHQGTNLDLIDADPFDLEYEDPRDPEEPEEPEILGEPLDANEVRKFENGIKTDEEQPLKETKTLKEYTTYWFGENEYPSKQVNHGEYDPHTGTFEDGTTLDDLEDWECEESLKEHINDRPAAIESDQKLQGTDNAVVKCDVAKVIAHSEDEKPLDCEMKKPALEKPLAGDEVDIKVNEGLTEAKEDDGTCPYCHGDNIDLVDSNDDSSKYICRDCGEDFIVCDDGTVTDRHGRTIEALEEAAKKKDEDELPPDPEAVKLEVHQELNNLVNDEISAIDNYETAKADILDKPIEHKDDLIDTINHIEAEEKEHIDELIDATSEIPFGGEHKEAAPAVEEAPTELPAEEGELDQEFPEVEEGLEEPKTAKVGDKIRIISLADEDESYFGKEGVVDHIDDLGQLHGTWGGLAIIPESDKFEIISESLPEAKEEGKYIVRFDFSDFSDGSLGVCEEKFDTKEDALKYINDSYDNWYADNGGIAEAVIYPILCRAEDDDWDEDDNGNYILESLKKAGLREAKEEGDKEVSYNKALAVAKSKNKPVIYGYSNKSYDGKFFELKDPIVCDSVFDETKKFKAQYKSCGTVYVAYPNRSFAEGLKLTEGAEEKPERFTPEEQAEYNCDEDGNSLEGFDTLHHCAWCGDVETAGEMKHELNFGWLCSRCVADLKSRGETLTVVESVEDDVEHDEDYERSWGPEKVECSKCHTQAHKDECRQADDGSWICAECDESLKESDKQPEEEIRAGLPSSNINFIRTDGKKAVIYYKDGNIEKIDAERRPDEEK